MAEVLTDEIDFSFYMRETDAKAKVKPASTWVPDVKAKLRENATRRRVFLPWDKTFGCFNFRPGEVTLWGGQNGHGKSQVTTQIAMSLMGQGERVCIASFEMKPVTTVQRMTRMYSQYNPFSPEFQGDAGFAALEQLFDEFGEWSDGRLWLYDQTGTAEAERVIGMCRYVAKELGVTQIVVDSLMKCVRDEDDYNGQKSFVDELCAVAKDYGAHIHLVHHLKKPANESAIPDKHDNKGSGAITDQVDNIMMVWRNKPKEDEIKAKGDMAPKRAEPDAYLLCRKQRNHDGNGDNEPTIRLWLHRDSGQFLGDPSDQPMFFPNFPHRATEYQ